MELMDNYQNSVFVFSVIESPQHHRNIHFNPLTPELNPSAQRCLIKFFTGDFAS
jgi:hypothetical protein